MRKIVFDTIYPAFYKSLYEWIQEDDERLKIYPDSHKYRLEQFLYFIYRYKKLNPQQDICLHIFGNDKIEKKFTDWWHENKKSDKFSFHVFWNVCKQLSEFPPVSNGTGLSFYLVHFGYMDIFREALSFYIIDDVKKERIRVSTHLSRICAAMIH